MKIFSKHQIIEKIDSTCSVIEYLLNHSLLDVAIATISGQYPKDRCVVNQEYDELAYVFAGEVKLN